MHDYTRYFPVRGDDDQLDVQGILHAGLNATPDRMVLAFDAEQWSVGRLRRHVALSQAWLAGQGMVAGDRVAVMLKNHPAHVALIYALILSGMVWVPVNTRLKSAGLQYLIDHAKLGHKMPSLDYRRPSVVTMPFRSMSNDCAR